MKKVIIPILVFFIFVGFHFCYANEKGHLFIIGGGKRPGYLMKEFVRLAGGKNGKVVVIPNASSRPLDVALYQKYQIEQQGAGHVSFAIFDKKSADADSTMNVFENANGIFFSGGDQRRLAKSLVNTKLLKKIKQIYENGGVIGGTSAGAAVMSEIMITGDELKNPDSTRSFHTIKKGNIVTDLGFAFIKSAIIDQHFVKRKRNNRLISLILENSELIGIGIDESTAIIVKSDNTFEVIGDNTVIIYDASNVRSIDTDKNDNFSVIGMQMHVLKSGDIYNLNSRQVIQ